MVSLQREETEPTSLPSLGGHTGATAGQCIATLRRKWHKLGYGLESAELGAIEAGVSLPPRSLHVYLALGVSTEVDLGPTPVRQLLQRDLLHLAAHLLLHLLDFLLRVGRLRLGVV